jgi:hypothetical protein
MPRISLLQVPNAPQAVGPAMGPQLGQLATPTPVDVRGGIVDTSPIGRAQANLGNQADHIQRGARVGVAAMEQGKRQNVRPEMFAGAGYGIGAVGEALGQASKALSFFAEKMQSPKENVDRVRVDGVMRDTQTGLWTDIQTKNIPETEWMSEVAKRTPDMRKRIADLKISPRIAWEIEADILNFESRLANDVAMKATKQSLEIAKGTILNGAERAFLAGDYETGFNFIDSAERQGLLRRDEAESTRMKFEKVARNESIAAAINDIPEAVEADLAEAKRSGKSEMFPDLLPTEIANLHSAALSQVRQTRVLAVEGLDEKIIKGEITTEEGLQEAAKSAKVQISEKELRSLKKSLVFEQAQTPESIAKYQQFYGQVMDAVAGYDARQDPDNEKYLQILRTIRERVEPGEREWLLRDLNAARTDGRKPNADIQANLFKRIDDLSRANAFGDPKKIFDRKGEVKDWDAYMAAQQKAVTLRGQMRGWLEQNPGATEAQAFDYFKSALGSDVADNVVFSLLGEKPEVAPVPQNNPRSRQPRQQQSITPDAIDALLQGGAGATAPTSGNQSLTEKIIGWEASSARRDKDGNLKVYPLPEGDGGGSFEVAGINERFHGPVARKLKSLIESGQHQEAERLAQKHIEEFTHTSPVVKAVRQEGVKLALMDAAFNRGPTGAVMIAQKALGVAVTGKFSEDTRRALVDAEKNPQDFLHNFRDAREWYEITHAKRSPGNKFWNGLVNRWDSQLEESLKRS